MVFLAAALTATTAFALSPVERKESILEKVINTIRNYADMLTSTSTMVEVPRYRYEEYSFIEVPNEQVQEVIDTWVIFRNSVNLYICRVSLCRKINSGSKRKRQGSVLDKSCILRKYA